MAVFVHDQASWVIKLCKDKVPKLSLVSRWLLGCHYIEEAITLREPISIYPLNQHGRKMICSSVQVWLFLWSQIKGIKAFHYKYVRLHHVLLRPYSELTLLAKMQRLVRCCGVAARESWRWCPGKTSKVNKVIRSPFLEVWMNIIWGDILRIGVLHGSTISRKVHFCRFHWRNLASSKILQHFRARS